MRNRSLQERVAELEEKICQIQVELERKDADLKQTVMDLSQKDLKIRNIELKNKKLHSMIIDTGSNQVNPDDSEIVTAFGNLDHHILQVVMKYYNNHAPKLSGLDDAYWRLSPENKTLHVRGFIAHLLWCNLFAPGRLPWGFPKEHNDLFSKLEHSMIESKKGMKLYPRTISYESVSANSLPSPRGRYHRMAR